MCQMGFYGVGDEGDQRADVEERRPIYEEIQLAAQEDAVVVWMYQAIDRVHLQRWIDGFYYNPAYGDAALSWVYSLSKAAP